MLAIVTTATGLGGRHDLRPAALIFRKRQKGALRLWPLAVIDLIHMARSSSNTRYRRRAPWLRAACIALNASLMQAMQNSFRNWRRYVT
jgi:hypothetical protein